MKRTTLALVALLAGCSSTKASLPDPPTSARGQHSCPLGEPGAIVTIDDTADGAVFTFIARDHVDDLRRRVADAANLYGPGAHRGEGHAGLHGRGQKHGLALWELIPVRTTVEPIEGGARLRVTAGDLADLVHLRGELHERAERVAVGECP